MTEKPNQEELLNFRELLTANSIMVETLTRLLMEKGIITNEEFFTRLTEVQAEYHSKGGQGQ
jgi:hypothetical protein